MKFSTHDAATHELLDDLIEEVRALRRDVRRSTQTQHEDQEHTVANLEALAAEVQENSDVVTSASTLIAGLAEELRNAQDDPAAIAALADQLDQNTARLAAAVDAVPHPDQGLPQ